MNPIPLQELADRLGGSIDPQSSTLEISGFATDSRDVKPGDLFIAIRGAQVDGHAYVEAAMGRGAVAALVERPVSAPHIRVLNLVSSLARMARSFREEFDGPVIGVTGSAGKSSCKEFLAAALAPLGEVLKTEGNRNTEYTAPLMWAELNSPSPRGGERGPGGEGLTSQSFTSLAGYGSSAPHPGAHTSPTLSPSGGEGSYAAVVVEMGMRGAGQIAHLASFSRPNIAIITNIGVSHLSELGSREAIARAKGELLEALPEDGVAVLWAEDDFLPLLEEIALRAPVGSSRRVMTFGFSSSAGARIVSYRATGWESAEIEIAFEGDVYPATLPVVGRHQALNAAAAFLAAVAAGVPPTLAAKGLKNAQLPPMRMAIRQRSDVTYVLDMYNASPPSVMAALETVRDVFESQGRPSTLDPRPSEFVAVLGEMRELGEHSEQGHREVGEVLVQFGVDRVILLAPDVGTMHPTATIREAAIAAGMDASKVHVASSHEEVKALLTELGGPAVVLVKGSRGVELERALPEGIL
jgi:UDP-N-acetylmuramoyl-tripeptide--D-alanyl-D-alanine ligase